MPSPDTDVTNTFAEVLSEAIAHRNLTLERLSHRLRAAGTPVSIATLSYWQTGRSLPTRNRSLRAVAELEQILRVPVGQLSNALPGDVVSQWDPVVGLPRDEQVDTVLRSLGMDPRMPFTSRTLHDSLLVDTPNQRHHQTTRHLLRADVEGLDRFPLIFHQARGEDLPATPEAGVGCELGRVVQLDEQGLVVGEMLLAKPLRKGELAMVDYRMSWDTAHDDEPGYTRQLRSSPRFLVMDLTFRGPLPQQVTYWNAPLGSTRGDELAKEQPVEPEEYVQVVLTDPSGNHGLAWWF